jgi:large subunit ribosomal protein L18
MDNSLKRKISARKTRVFRVRNQVRGTTERPRLSVNKSNAHLYAQIIDDEKGITLVGIGTQSKANQASPFNRKSKEAAKHIGQQIAKLAKEKKVTHVVFDRGANQYHGVIAAIADGAREAGLQF